MIRMGKGHGRVAAPSLPCDNRRTGSDTMMSSVLYGVSDADIKAMAHFLAHAR